MASAESRTSRRHWVLGTLAGVGGGVAVLMDARPARAAAHPGVGRPAPENSSPLPHASSHVPCTDIAALVEPLGVGARLGPWKIEQVLPLSHGAAGLVLSDADGVRFQVDVCARDFSAGAPRPPASSECFDLFLANGGKGATASLEHHGLAAMAIADVIRHNEQRLSHEGFATLTERLAVAPDAVRTAS
jgi:hypothetical protein